MKQAESGSVLTVNPINKGYDIMSSQEKRYSRLTSELDELKDTWLLFCNDDEVECSISNKITDIECELDLLVN